MAYTTIDDPSAYFHTQLYTGNGSGNNPRAITNDANSDIRPDWIWIKERSSTSSSRLVDSSRGGTKGLTSDTAAGEDTANFITFGASDGFTLTDYNGGTNQDSQTYVAWQWVANGGTTTTNDASSTSVGTIDSVYQADTTAGFSIVTFTGTGSAGTIAHGLGSTPQVIITKDRGAVENWIMHHHTLGATFIMRMDDTTAKVDAASYNDTLPASTVFSVDDGGNNQSGNTYVSYCFAEKQGYSKFGSFVGNGNADGPFVYLGFKPAWILYKRAGDGTNNWGLIDNKRDTHNPCTNTYAVNLSNVVGDSSGNGAGDFLSNGWKIGVTAGSRNASGVTYIYMAFAEHPFVSSKGVPTTAR